MTERELLMLMERDPQLAMALMYIAAMGEQERRTQMSNYDKFKNWLCDGLGIAKGAVQSAWNWFKSLW
jgi:hypothetical protein